MEEIVGEKESEKIIENRKGKLKNFFFGWIEDNYDKAFLGVLIAAFIIYLLVLIKTLHQPLWWDSASYMTAAKRWGLGLNVEDIWYYRRGALFALVGALSFKLGFGEGGMRFLAVLLSTGIVAVSYFLIKEIFNKKLALLTSIFLSMSWLLLFFTGRVLTDIPSAFLILLSLLLFWKGYVLKKGNKFLYLSSFFFALAILTRMQNLMFIPVFLFVIFLKEKFRFFKNKNLGIALIILLIMLLPHFLIYSQHYGNPVTDIYHHYFSPPDTTNLPQDSPGTSTFDHLFSLSYFKSLPYILQTPTFILFIIGVFLFFTDLFLGLDKIFKNEEIQKKAFVFFLIFSQFFILSYLGSANQVYVEERYIILCLPFLGLITVYPLIKLEEILLSKYIKNKVSLLLIIILILILLLIPNYNWGNSLIDNKKNSYSEVRQAGLWIKDNSNPSDITLSSSEPQMTYYSERNTFSVGANESDFEKRILEFKPKYFMLSAFEEYAPWAYEYPQKHNDTVIPVQVYKQNNQPVLIIYEFKYENEKT